MNIDNNLKTKNTHILITVTNWMMVGNMFFLKLSGLRNDTCEILLTELQPAWKSVPEIFDGLSPSQNRTTPQKSNIDT